jgi:hypothetical protein
MKAYLIGEKSGGMTAVEIYDDVGLAWSAEWFAAGCSADGYVAGLCQAFDAMADCGAGVAHYEGQALDEEGNMIAFDDGEHTGVMLEYDSIKGSWSAGECARTHGQSSEIVDACMVAGLVAPDEEHADHADDDVVQAIARHIARRSAW